ncbi:LPS biosynthesis protein [Pelistega indica]|uniref:LPS biosynthesis protein n=1 Tax=Pelistega indica TaxID=1414851 RepID=V8G7X7_9BURK|nr:NAD(P)-binding protein [Pelistega indica]ETD72639.1 LPS biosynthesis protein [Pelistega indica]
MQTCKYLVIGAGVSGLTFANFINDKDYLIVEKSQEPGGFCRTIYQDGYIWDYAGHFFHFATDKIKNFFKNKIKDDELVYKKKCTKIFYNGLIIDFPFQANIHQLEKSEFIDCLYDLYFREKQGSKEVFESFLQMLYGKFGISITEKFLKPYNEKLYACDLDMLDQDAMGRFFPYADIGQVIRNFKNDYSGSYNAEFMYPKRGAMVFVDALSEGIDRDKIILGEQVTSINLETKVATTNKNRQIKFEYIINSSPLNQFLGLFEGNTSYKEFINTLSWNKVLVFNLGFAKKSSIKDIHWAYIPSKDINFYRVGFYDNILDSDKLSMYVEIGLSANQQIDIDEQLKLTLINLKKLGIVDEDNELLSHATIMMDPAYVHVDSKLEETKQLLKSELQKHNVFVMGRYGDWKYCSIEDSMRDALALTEKFNA